MEWRLPKLERLWRSLWGFGGNAPGKIFLARLAHSCETDFQVLGFYVVWLLCSLCERKKIVAAILYSVFFPDNSEILATP